MTFIEMCCMYYFKKYIKYVLLFCITYCFKIKCAPIFQFLLLISSVLIEKCPLFFLKRVCFRLEDICFCFLSKEDIYYCAQADSFVSYFGMQLSSVA